ncbi:hypothetical protein [Hyphobacterium sp.]|uniref:hypothetical protein n=1 Tax=Hyphobacterium sp. TaxID=2004662 RepID=UPI003BAB7268
MTVPTYIDRRSAGAAEQVIALEAERVSVTENGTVKRAIRYEDLREIRLSIGLAGRDSQVLCRLTGRDNTRILFGSRSWKAIGEWENRADRFREFNAALHARALAHAETIAFIEGQPFWSGLLLPCIGLALAALGAAFALYFLREGNPLALVGLPGMAIGLYLAWILRPRPAKPYDPETYARTANTP